MNTSLNSAMNTVLKYILIGAAVIILISGGIFIYHNYFAKPKADASELKQLVNDLKNQNVQILQRQDSVIIAVRQRISADSTRDINRFEILNKGKQRENEIFNKEFNYTDTGDSYRQLDSIFAK